MITGLDHIAIIVSSEDSITFYKRLGFREKMRRDRSYDVIVFLVGHGLTLEVYIDPSHPQRVTNPEAMGLRHLALHVDSIEKTVDELCLSPEVIRKSNGVRFTFIKDPDGLPIELHE